MRKNKKFAALLAIFGGSIGLHRFYLGQPGLGILYILLFMFFGISGILGIIDAFMLFFMSDEEFEYRYNKQLGKRGDFNRARREQMRQRTAQRTGQRTPPQRNARYNPQTKRRRPADTRPRPPARRIPKRNPYKQTGIKKFKEFALEEAIEDFKKGIEISPNDVSLHFNIACAYSLTEQADLAFKHLSLAVENGFKDFDLIKSHDALAYARIQPNWDEFEEAGFQMNKSLPSPDDDNILEEDLFLEQIKKLVEMRQKGILTDEEFIKEKAKLKRR